MPLVCVGVSSVFTKSKESSNSGKFMETICLRRLVMRGVLREYKDDRILYNIRPNNGDEANVSRSVDKTMSER